MISRSEHSLLDSGSPDSCDCRGLYEPRISIVTISWKIWSGGRVAAIDGIEKLQ